MVIYVCRPLPGDELARLAEFDVRNSPDRDAEVLVPTYLDPVDAARLGQLPKLRLVASYGVGTDHVDLAACAARGVAVTNTPGVLTEATADHAFALLLAAARRVAEGDRLIRAGRWTASDPSLMLGVDVHRKTLGLVGFGRI